MSLEAVVNRMRDCVEGILRHTPVDENEGEILGESREGRAIRGFRFGDGDISVSLLAGCHADEPVGPRLLSRLCGYLSSLPSDDELLSKLNWWIVPHINPDGADSNNGWQSNAGDSYDLAEYLSHRVRELPGDDIEFGFPRTPDDTNARPENDAVYRWWCDAANPFSLHMSLHGMGFAAGPWFLIEEAWRNRCSLLKDRCVQKVQDLGYALHDVERNGEKGFFRLGRGFCTRPDSRYMRRHFLDLGDERTASLFRPSSMETIRSLGGDPLTLVSEMPLFLLPGVGEVLGPPDPAALEWKNRVAEWTEELNRHPGASVNVVSQASDRGLKPMPIHDQMILQWTFIAAGLEQVVLELDPG